MKKSTQMSTSKETSILFVSYTYWPPDFGGELLLSVERFHSLQQRGYRTIVLTSGKIGFQREESSNNIHIFRTPIIHNSKLGRALRRIIFSLIAFSRIALGSYETVHYGSFGLTPLFNHTMGWLSSLIVKLRGKKSVWVFSLADSESDIIRFDGISGYFRKLFLQNMTYLVSVSPALHEGLNKYFNNTYLIPYGIRDDIFIPMTEANKKHFRQQYFTNSVNVLILSFLGSIGTRKGFDLIAKAFVELADIIPDLHLWVIGPVTKKENQNLNETEVELVCAPLSPFNKRVKFWGRIDNREELSKIIGSTDIFLFPSRQEGMGIAPLEAMATGVPPIISRIPGITDLANIEGVTGLYVTPDSYDELKRAILLLSENHKLRTQMGKNAVLTIQESFSWEKYINKWERIYASKA